ncbi:hypothetical protein D1O30_19025 [Methylocystis hirsuta]|uniref:Uncharacterized protein n=1 Tax=Methylocystis hirsuta TaxID=369798 RepID=A0A3M9XUQ3_9HYPH|nr:hypothetical protein D1O30_19025 [Methylocystis hirsuta]
MYEPWVEKVCEPEVPVVSVVCVVCVVVALHTGGCEPALAKSGNESATIDVMMPTTFAERPDDRA